MQIIAPIDFGIASATVLKFASDLALEVGGEVTLLYVHHVLDDPRFDDLRIDAEIAIERRMQTLIEEAVGPDAACARHISALSTRDVIADGILGAAAAADLIVVGQTESRGVWRFMLGDVTGQVIEKAACPVLVVPAGTSFAPPARIRTIIEGDFPSEAYAPPLRELAAAFGSLIDVYRLVAHELDADDDSELADFVAGQAHDYHVSTQRAALFDYLTASVDVLEANWLCTVQRDRAAWVEALTRSLSERVAAIAPMPTLVLTNRERRSRLVTVGPSYTALRSQSPTTD